MKQGAALEAAPFSMRAGIMNRKIIKGVLFFGGLAVATVAMAVFFANFLSTKTLVLRNVYITAIIVGAGLVLTSLALLMHAKYVRETKNGLSVLCRILAIYRLVTGGINLVGGAVLLIVIA
jgi:hypothetical protein